MDDRMDVLVQGVDRITLLKIESSDPFIRSRIRLLSLPNDLSSEVEALQRSILDMATRILQLGQPKSSFDPSQLADLTQNPLQLAYMMASMLNLDFEKAQSILEAETVVEALRILYGHMAHEVEVLELRHKIASHAQTEMTRQQREYVLRQQLRAIQEELGEASTEKSEAQELRAKLKEIHLPELVRKRRNGS